MRHSINLLITVIHLLIGRLSLNSQNSSLPPSSDGIRKKRGRDKKKRKSKNPVGGQEGHPGETLEQYEEPDEIIATEIDRRTLPRGVTFTVEEPEKRQVIDLHMDFIVREYQVEVLVDSGGNRHVAPFPEHITKAIQYGPSIKSLAVYLLQYQLIPYNRLQELLKDQFGLEVSQGTLYDFNQEAFGKLESFEMEMIGHLGKSPVLNADETGIAINEQTAWLHVLSNSRATLFFAHEKRGKEAMDALGVIKNYTGILCHDRWKPYLGYKCQHALCNAHHLRELQWVTDCTTQKWAASMKRFLIKLNERVDKHGGVLLEDDQEKQIKRYREIIQDARKECPIVAKAKGDKRRGRPKQTTEAQERRRRQSYRTVPEQDA